MRVLVTGAAGFIGSAVCAELGERGHEVVRVDALIPQAHPASAVVPPGLQRVDIRDQTRIGGLLRGVDVVCHQAAMVGAGVGPLDLPHYAGHNDLGTATLLAAMHEHGVGRLVLASSMVVYGEGGCRCPDHGPVIVGPRRPADLERGQFDPACPHCHHIVDWVPVDEDAPLRPGTSYAASKVAQEHYAAAWASQAAGAVVALRYHNVYGPWMPRDTPYSGVAAAFRSRLQRGQPPAVFEDGAQTRDFVHVSDVARANALAIEYVVTNTAGTLAAFNVCSGSPVTILEVAGLLCGALGGDAPVVTGEYRSGDVRHVVASPARAAAALGFTAEVSPASGLRDFATAPLRPTA